MYKEVINQMKSKKQEQSITLRKALRLAELSLKPEDQIITKVLNKNGTGERVIYTVSEIPESKLDRHVVKIQFHQGGKMMNYNGLLFLLK